MIIDGLVGTFAGPDSGGPATNSNPKPPALLEASSCKADALPLSYEPIDEWKSRREETPTGIIFIRDDKDKRR